MTQDGRRYLLELRQSGERVIAISILAPDKPGLKGFIKGFDDYHVELEGDGGKIELLPIHQYRFRRVEKEVRR